MARRIAGCLALVAGLLAPLGLSVLWIPERTTLPNTDLALILVLAVVAIGSAGRRSAVAIAAVSAAFWFELFDTQPFERLAIERRPDVETTVVLAFVALVGGELAVQRFRHRVRARSGAARFSSISETASLLATGEELSLVIQAVADQLSSLLDLRGCHFEAGPGADHVQSVDRNGVLCTPAGEVTSTLLVRRDLAVLPVWGHSQVLGHYVLELTSGTGLLQREILLVAVTLADQVGAAFMAQAPPPPDPATAPTPHLHVVP